MTIDQKLDALSSNIGDYLYTDEENLDMAVEYYNYLDMRETHGGDFDLEETRILPAEEEIQKATRVTWPEPKTYKPVLSINSNGVMTLIED